MRIKAWQSLVVELKRLGMGPLNVLLDIKVLPSELSRVTCASAGQTKCVQKLYLDCSAWE